MGERRLSELCDTYPMSNYCASTSEVDAELDVQGLNCPMPLLKAKQALNRLSAGDLLSVIATSHLYGIARCTGIIQFWLANSYKKIIRIHKLKQYSAITP